MARIPSADGIMLHVEAHGDGFPIVFANGLYTTLENWRPQVAPCVEAGMRVILWDYRGHGRSDAPEAYAAYSFERVLDDFERVLDWAAPAAPAALVGLSFGGLASLHLALARPERVCALVLASTGPGFKNPEAQARWASLLERSAERIERDGSAALLAGRAAATLIGRCPEHPAARAAARAIAAQRPRAVALFARCVAAPLRPVIDRLQDVPHPSLVIAGAEDISFHAAAELMAARIPRAERVMLAGAGHMLNLDQPEAFNAVLIDFLARRQAAPGSSVSTPDA
ncbi:MAG: alpha/beta hydrolase [Myxococcales bacterium]|nr:alpha/beta hydrolase [Myxococcales bacterium]MDH5305795.1 alpha/beta hydrolase [Myxococcales bacterium]MDH5565784.1 alpha/beta hydrolase [Myxococcales bacterium]